jgi:hypothetical protein
MDEEMAEVRAAAIGAGAAGREVEIPLPVTGVGREEK